MKKEFIKDFFSDYPDKEVLKNFIDKELPVSGYDKKFLILKYCGEKVTPNKIMAYELGVSERYVKKVHNEVINRTLPYINIIFIKALNTSL